MTALPNDDPFAGVRRATGNGALNPHNQEIVRIVRLPIERPITPEEVEEFSRIVVAASAFDSGWRLKPDQAAAVLAFMLHKGGFFPIGVGKGKCVAGDTEFYDLELGRRRADETGPAVTPSMDSRGNLIPSSASVFPSGRKECLRLGLMSGQAVTISTDHPVFTDRGWVRADSIGVDDLIATPRKLPPPKRPTEVDPNLVKFIAYMMSDGCTSGCQPNFTNMSIDVWEDFSRCLHALGGGLGARKEAGRAWTYSVCGMGQVLRRAEQWGCKSTNKRLPSNWYLLDDEMCALFLSRFIACDGHVRQESLEITLANEGLIRDIRHLMLRLGVCANVRIKVIGDFKAWRLFVTGDDWRRLAAILPEIPGKVEDQLRAQSTSTIPNTNVDVVPFGRSELQEACSEMGIQGRGGCWRRRAESVGPSRSDLRAFLGASAGQRVSRSKFRAFVGKFDYRGKYSWLAESDLRWSRVRSIERVGELDVFDLNVPGTESWIGNGIVLHNTLISMLVADMAYREGISRSLLLIPPEVYSQFIKRDVPFYRAKVQFTVRFIGMGDMTQQQRRRVATSGLPGCYVMPYSVLSTRDSEDNITAIAPKLIIADEAHRLRNPDAARTQRIRRLIDKFEPLMVAMSGTITNRSILDYWHLIKSSLRHNCPLPIQTHIAMAWAQVLDAKAETSGSSTTSASTGPLLPLVQWARKHFPQEEVPESTRGFRRAYKLRLHTAPGVVASRDNEIGTSLIFANSPVPEAACASSPGWEELQAHIKKLRKEMVTPTGDELEYAIHAYKWHFELSAGFYNDLYWPEPERVAEKQHVSLAEAEERLERGRDQHRLQQQYHRLLRGWLNEHGRQNLDTPMLVGLSMARHGNAEVRDSELYDAWHAAREAKFEGMPERLTRPVFVCPYKVDHVARWIREELPKGAGCIVWLHNRELGKWQVERLREHGVDALHCPAGDKYNDLIAQHGDPNAGGKGDRVIVASIGAHGTGKNLQAFQHTIVVQWPRNAVTAEQMIGRVHRQGQMADELKIVRVDSTWFDRANMAACLNDAAYIHGTTGPQKLLTGTWEQAPLIFNSEALRQAGFDVQKLTGEQVALLRERFGTEQENID